ncbi:MAG: cystathionine beta-synthase [Gammaproteobacteria bacterium]|nr:cystathionine beta-synthase [Gammaproteobacteria bacterium]
MRGRGPKYSGRVPNGQQPTWLRSAALSLSLVCLLAAGPVAAAAPEEISLEPSEYSREGADTCLRCHDSPHILEFFRTPHAVREDPDTPFAQLQCESCHGPGANHAQRLRPGQTRPPILNFGQDEPFSLAQQNGVCLACHQQDMGSGWHGSAHDADSLACADCHVSHTREDPMLASAVTQADSCQSCHLTVRAEFQRAFHHPVRSGEMSCSECHAVHDSAMPSLLTEPTLTGTCHGCHQEMRGPFLWEHVPASEDCSACHRPHGSVHRALLTKAAPLLCQDCHSRSGHPSIPRTGRSLPGARPSPFLLSGSCLNCHSRVHGSNHPSGANLTR